LLDCKKGTRAQTWSAYCCSPGAKTADDYIELLTFVDDHGLVGSVQPVQFALRLLLPPGSPLVPDLAREDRLGHFESEALTYTWSNPDSRMDLLQRDISAIVEAAAATHDCDGAEPSGDTFRKVKQTAFRVLAGRELPDSPARPIRAVPGLTESWFC
jgi:hypothetical protein